MFADVYGLVMLMGVGDIDDVGNVDGVECWQLNLGYNTYIHTQPSNNEHKDLLNNEKQTQQQQK